MNHLSKRLLSLLLLLCMILSVFAGCTGETPTDTSSIDTDTSSINSNTSGSLSIEDILPEDTPLKYTLTEQDLIDLKAMIPSVKEKMLAVTTNEAAEEEMKPLEDKFNFIMAQSNVAEVLYYCHQEDAKAKADYLFAKETVSAAYMALVAMEEEIYHENPPYRDEYFDGMTPEELDQLLIQREKETELNTLQAQITAEFYGNAEYADRTKVDKLYNSYIKMGKTVAEAADAENFYEYSFKNIYNRDYSKEDREQFRKYVNQYIVPLLMEATEAFATSMDELSYVQQMQIARLIDTMAYDELEDSYLMGYISSLSGSTKDGMMHMFDNQYFICADWEDSHDGAFTTTFDEPFCYFGPGVYQTTFTVAHELGHYYAELHLDEDHKLSYDMAETHSQGNEVLLLNYLETRLEPEVYNTLVNYTVYEFAYNIFLSTVLDHFEERVYTTKDSDTFTTKQYEALMDDVLSEYNISEEFGEIMQMYWKEICVTSPVYYISYATSAVASLNLYSLCTKDKAGALETYRKLVEAIDEESDFVGTLKKAGLPTPFEEEAYTSLKNLLKK